MAPTNSNGVQEFPRTVETAVDLVLSRMSDGRKEWLQRFDGHELALQVKFAADVTAGMNVRAMLGLWGENPELLAQVPRRYRHPDDASSYFVIECWERLRAESDGSK